MEGYRATEGGDLRILEDGDSRVTERFYDGFADLTAQGSLFVVSNATILASVSLSSTGSTLLVGEAILFGRTALNGQGTTSVDGDLVASGAHVGTATGTLSSSGVRIQPGATSLSGASSIVSAAGFKFAGASDIQAEGIFSATPKLVAYGLFDQDDQNVIRLLENGDVRITEEGDTRIVSGYQPNTAYGSIISQPSVVLFVSEPYAKYQSSWLRAVPYVKYENDWVVPEKAYKYLTGRWKRIY